MRKFVIKDGVHHADGKVFGKGETVESDLNLAVIFPGKFVEQIATEAVPAKTPVLVTSVIPPAEAVVKAPAAPAAPVKAVKPKAPRAKVESSLGEDVSDKFHAAIDLDYHVFEKSGKFSVCEAPNFDKPLNEDALASKEDVKTFLKTLAV